MACTSGSGASGDALPVGESSAEISAGVSASVRIVDIAARLGAVRAGLSGRPVRNSFTIVPEAGTFRVVSASG